MIAYIGLGSNLHNPKEQIQSALSSLSAHNNITLMCSSSLYRSKPIDNSSQPDYLNAVCKIDTSLTALELLKVCQYIECQQHRIKTKKWGPRTIDLDIILYDDRVITTKELVIPHPELANRAFVLVPLYALEPKLTVPLLGSVKELLTAVDVSSVTQLS